MKHIKKLKALAKKVEALPQKKVEKLTREIVAVLHDVTPVRTGAATSSWGATIGGMQVTHKEVIVPEDTVRITPPVITKVSDLAEARITNLKDYLFDLNYLGTSQQAPIFFVQMAVARAIARVTNG